MKKRQLCYILSFLVIPALLSCAEFTAVGVPKEAETGKKVFVNQVGYLPDYFKRVVSAEEAGEFILLAEESKKEMYKGTLRPVYDRTSERVIWQGEFTSFVIPGRYRILVPGVGESYSFIIGPDVYNDPLKLGTRFLYLQRCGIELNDLETTGHYHPYCHLKDGFLARADQFYAANEKIFSVGGWHDAGDYGKYVSTTTVTAAQMLTAYELWPEKFYDGQFDIPESGNGIPDLLDEARIGLEWLFTMQRPDGAVYHKLSGSRWPSINTTPDFDRQPRYIYGISTADTAKFVATMAIAARIYEEVDPVFARKALVAAEKSWKFLCENPDFIWDHSGFDDEGSGAYGSATDRPDRLWAAFELVALFGRDDYLAEVVNVEKVKAGEERLDRPTPLSWSDSALLGYFHYARAGKSNPDLQRIVEDLIIEAADSELLRTKESGYRYSLKFSDFAWASNKEGLARGITMILAHQLRPNPEYLEAALAQLDFVLGLNPLSKCFVAQLGTNTVRNPHHRLVASRRKPLPGLVVGGPNNNSESLVEPANQGPFSYADAQNSYSSNETAIDYNAAFILAVSAFAGTQQ
ncbi:MAG TPA: glycosyl hydrolase family 5 [Firmicutes bacterium]|nr:glycosyl hydrolase family 5 [Bacillota bacterium]